LKLGFLITVEGVFRCKILLFLTFCNDDDFAEDDMVRELENFDSNSAQSRSHRYFSFQFGVFHNLCRCEEGRRRRAETCSYITLPAHMCGLMAFEVSGLRGTIRSSTMGFGRKRHTSFESEVVGQRNHNGILES
jgi:hypothetical protein